MLGAAKAEEAKARGRTRARADHGEGDAPLRLAVHSGLDPTASQSSPTDPASRVTTGPELTETSELGTRIRVEIAMFALLLSSLLFAFSNPSSHVRFIDREMIANLARVAELAGVANLAYVANLAGVACRRERERGESYIQNQL